MMTKIFQKPIVGILVALLIMQVLPTVSAEELEPVVEPVVPITEEVPVAETVAEPIAPITEEVPVAETIAEPVAPSLPVPKYNQLMRQVDSTVDSKELGQSLSSTVLTFFPAEIQDEKRQISKENVGQDLQIFIDSEKTKLQDSPIDEAKKETYFNQLEKQLAIVKGEIPAEPQEAEEIKIPEKPSSFSLEKKEIKIEQVENLVEKKNIDPGLIEKTFEKLQLIQVAEAYLDSYMPVLEDLQADSGEVVINQEIRDLAVELEGNPVKIFNFVRNNIDYESYYGSKKGSVGCLRERVCNDVDAASLTIALMRAAGIPARYKKSLALVNVQQLKELLGVEETQTVFQALQMPVFTVDGVVDFNAMTKLAVEWVHPEIFYQYDERSANFSSPPHEEFADIEAMRLYFRGFKGNQWLPVEVMMKGYTHTANEIVQDTAGFDTEDFWQRYLQYQGELSPMDKYQEELAISSENAATQSEKQLIQEEFDFLPYTLPYQVAEGEAAGNPIFVESFSTLPDRYKHQVRISLLNSGDQQPLFSHTFFFSEVDNQPIELNYQGFTDLDETTIVEHGGIHATPAALVDIKPFLMVNGTQYMGDQPLEIGQNLILQFEYPDLNKVDQKFSVAGNSEGIFMYFSKLQANQLLDDETDPDRNSKILLEGNAMMAREYLRKVENNTELVSRYLDYGYDIAVHRAVVTQNRITNELDNVATTFDFKGLSIDASLYGNGYSNRGNFEIHGDDFSRLWLLYASYYEAQVFEDLSGLNAISTVKGLQYAYANPAQYAVLTITADNSEVIDGLDFSANTKANMHDDIAAGATIITPNHPVQKENWRGIVYISRDPDGVDKYAIGEQAQGNGGYTIDPTIVSNYPIEHNVGGNIVDTIVDIITINKPDGNYIYQDGLQYVANRTVAGVNCSITKKVNDEWVARVGWEEEWGAPCYKPGGFDKVAGQGISQIAQKFLDNYGFLPILTTNGVKFYDPDYQLPNQSYWISQGDLFDGFDSYIQEKNNLDSNNLNWLEGGHNTGYKFSTILGSYLWKICEKGTSSGCKNDANVYYVPSEDGGDYFRARNGIFDKLGSSGNAVIAKLGLPTSDEVAVESDFGTKGVVQDFLNGKVFKKNIDNLFKPKDSQVSYISEATDKYTQNIGLLGFPFEDPKESDGRLIQNFEGGRIEESQPNIYTITPIVYISDSYKDEEYNYLIINLNNELENRVCFKSYVGLKDGIDIGDQPNNDSYEARQFDDIINNDNNRKFKNDGVFYEPIAAVNGDYVDGENDGPLDINFSEGIDYSGSRAVHESWASIAISPNNEVSFSTSYSDEKKNLYSSQGYAVVGGGPLLAVKNADNVKLKDICPSNPKLCGGGFRTTKQPRTVIGVTNKNYMIILVGKNIDARNSYLYELINKYAHQYGTVQNANFFDGGDSPSLMYRTGINKNLDSDIKQQGGNDLSSLLLMYTGAACY